MATRTQLRVLPSSPPRQFTAQLMSSSPLPSPSEILGKKAAALRTNKPDVSMTPIALFSFTAVPALLDVTNVKAAAVSRSDSHGGLELDISEIKKAAKPKAKPSVNKKKKEAEPKPVKLPRKANPKTVDYASPAPNVKKPRKPPVKKAEALLEEDARIQELVPHKTPAKKARKEAAAETDKKPARKPRAKKADGKSQSQLPEHKVTKRSAKSKASEDLVEFGLVEAVKRKTTWTPPIPTAKEISISPVSPLVLDKDRESAGLDTFEKGKHGFGDLFGSFGYSNSNSCSGQSADSSTKTQDKGVLRKRKLIELVKTSTADGSIPTPKKAPKKKPRTITERATAAYAEKEDEALEPKSLLQYFSLQTTDNDGFSVPTAKGTKTAPIILSPESAMKQVANQDFIFGTSSQLAREDSPTLLRDLPEAMHASLEHVDPSDLAPEEFCSPARPKRNLWGAASRDADGQFLNAQLLDLTSDPGITASAAPVKQPEQWPDVEELVKSKGVKSSPVQPADGPELLSSSSGRDEPTSLSSKSSAPTHPKPSVASNSRGQQMPLYASYTTAQLAKEIASYCFKPVKSRQGMISLLERCWEGKHGTTLQTTDENPPVQSPTKTAKPTILSEASPQRPRGRPKRTDLAPLSPVANTKPGRPKKGAITAASVVDDGTKALAPKGQKKSKRDVEEISDSDTPVTPSPPRRRASRVGKPPPPLQLRAEETETSPERTSSQTQALLFEHITKAVVGAPSSKDSKNPSWHEKILLYDPIILEDLAVWLNTGALGKAGWDGEVAPSEVKRWCESKSICCLWRENLRGVARSRY